MVTKKGLKPGRASPEQLKASLERRRSNAAGVHVNKGLRDADDWRKELDDEIERYELDVNLLLEDLRDDIQEGLRRGYTVGCETPDTDLLLDICEALDNLDEHLSRGGFLPADWNRKA